MIASLHSPLVKHLVKIRENRKYREGKKTVLISGYKLIREISQAKPPKKLFLVNLEDATIAARCKEIFQVNYTLIKKITGLPSPEPVAAEFDLPTSSSLSQCAPILVLDAIQDPGNLGTLLRTALAIGWQGVFFLPSCVDPFHEKVIRSSRAALFRIPWNIGTWDTLLQLKKKEDFKVYLADTEGKPLSLVQPQKKSMLILSNEGQGIQEKALCMGEKITVPMEGEMESLNVAIAGAILMYYLYVSSE